MRITKEVIGGVEYESVTRRDWEFEAKRKQEYFDKYMKMTLAEVAYWREQWEAYYQAVKQTEAYRLYLEMKQAFREGNKTKIRELREKNRTITATTIKKPDFPNPDMLLYHMPKDQKDDMFAKKKMKKLQSKEAVSLLEQPNF